MKTFVGQLKARPHLMLSVAAGIVAALAVPPALPIVARLLLAWNVAAWSYLVQAFWVMARADHQHLRRTAISQSAGSGAVLAIAIAAVVASVAAIALQLATVKGHAVDQALPHVALALATVTGSWLLLPTLFALSYASVFHRREGGHGLLFPGAQGGPGPGYWDFLYFSFTIAVASQTSDVAVLDSAMRRLVLLQSVLSFAFNTAILAMMVNIAAGLV
jgi:uncharacterized membrane protein